MQDLSVKAMLETIEQMKFFLRTAFGDSQDCATSSLQVRTQGLCQGNGAAPGGWLVISIVILRCHKKKGHGATFMTPISRMRQKVAAIMYVDDTDILHVNMEQQESVEEAFEATQSSVLSWGALLLATGGAPKPLKCF